MANHKSAEKRARQAIGKNARNSATEGAVRTIEKRIHTAVASGDSGAAKTLLSEYTGKITRAAVKGVLHTKTASRKISRLSSRIQAMAAAGVAAKAATAKSAASKAAKAVAKETKSAKAPKSATR